jgi:hypothetical protein
MGAKQQQQKEQSQPQPQSNRPEQNLRYGGLEAAIWRNQGEAGDFLNTTFTRHFRQGEDWRQTDSFREQDLPTLSKIAADAHTAIQKLKAGNGDVSTGEH